MRYSLIVVEGPDDLAAIRELFLRPPLGPSKTQLLPSVPGMPRRATFRWADAETEVWVALDKQRVAERVVEQVKAASTSAKPFCQIGVCFDPDEHNEEQVRAWLLKECGAREAKPADDSCELVSEDANVSIVALPWDAGRPFDRLENLRNLERVAIEILNRVEKEEGNLVDQFLEVLQSKKKHTSWKTAFRLWAAIRYADRDPDTGGAIGQVFGQDEAVRGALTSVIEGSVFLTRLKRFAGAANA